VPTPRGDYGATVKTLTALVGECEEALGTQATVGVGIPGAMSLATGRIKNANSTCLIGRPFKQDLEPRWVAKCGWRTTRTALRSRRQPMAPAAAHASCSASSSGPVSAEESSSTGAC
jgi:hypothetical protein